MQHPAAQQSEAITHMSWFSAQLSQSLSAELKGNQDRRLLLHGLWSTQTQSNVASGGHQKLSVGSGLCPGHP